MKCLSREDGEAIFDELFVGTGGGALQDKASAVAFITEKRMTQKFHVRPYLMGSARFEAAFNKTHIIEIPQDFIMGYGMFPMTTIRENRHNQPVVEVSTHVAGNGSFI